MATSDEDPHPPPSRWGFAQFHPDANRKLSERQMAGALYIFLGILTQVRYKWSAQSVECCGRRTTQRKGVQGISSGQVALFDGEKVTVILHRPAPHSSCNLQIEPFEFEECFTLMNLSFHFRFTSILDFMSDHRCQVVDG